MENQTNRLESNGNADLNWDSFRAARERRGVPFVVAHRGAPTQQPENTLASFAQALDEGADALETDLRFTRDNEILLFHDATLDRTTDGQGNVSDRTLGEIKRLRTRRPNDAGWSDQAPPSLIELLAMTQGRTPLLLELKDPRFLEWPRAAQLVETLAAYGMLKRTAIVSFKQELVAAVKAVTAEIPCGHITLSNPLPKRNTELLGPAWPLLYLNPFYVAWAHRMGGIVAPLDPEPLPRLAYYLDLNVDALLADRPGLVVEALQRTRTDGAPA